MQDIEQGPLGRFEQDPLALAQGRVQDLPGVRQVGAERSPRGQEKVHQVVEGVRLPPEMSDEGVALGQDRRQPRSEAVRVAQVRGAHPSAGDHVLVGGADAAPRGPDAVRARGGFAQSVERLVVGEDQVGGPADREPVRVEVVARLGEGRHLGEERFGVQDHGGPDHAPHPRVQNPGRDLMEDDLLPGHDDRVAGIGPSLIAGDHVGAGGEQVRDLALALVPPLKAHDDETARHAGCLSRTGRQFTAPTLRPCRR